MTKVRNKKAPLKEEIARIKKERKQELRADGLNPKILDSTSGENGLLLQIDKPVRVNLHVTPELYRKAVEVIQANETTKLTNDPLSAKFWYGLLEDHHNTLDYLKEAKLEAKEYEGKAAFIRQRFNLRNEAYE